MCSAGDISITSDVVCSRARQLERPVDDALLAELCERIRGAVDANWIILFGSHAYGAPTDDSDIDLLVVVDTDEHPHAVVRRIYDRLSPRHVSLDVVVRTSAQIVDAFGDGFDPFLREVWRKGRVLYGCLDRHAALVRESGS